MAKRKGSRRKKTSPAGNRRRSALRRRSGKVARSAKRPTKRATPQRKARAPKPRAAKASTRVRALRSKPAPVTRSAAPPRMAASRPTSTSRKKTPRLDRVRRTLDDDVVQTPPSSLDMQRHGSAARTGRAEMEQSRQNLAGMSSDIAAGDNDVDVEDAYFTGDEVPGGDNPSPDQDVVEDIGKALGVQYDDNEELKGSDKIIERDRHRWEMDPASSEDYKERK